MLTFNLGRIPVRVRPEFFVLPLLGVWQVGAARGALWVAIVFVSVLWHELGHAWAMRAIGQAAKIELHGFGGWTLWPDGAQPSVRQRMFVTLAGPGIELAAGGAVWLGLRGVDLPPLAAFARDQWIWVNVGWALVNLLPILPWDGGQALDALLELTTGRPRPRVIGAVSMIAGALTLLAAFTWARSPMLGYLGGIGAWKGWQRWRGEEPQAQAPPEVAQAWDLVDRGAHAEAAAVLTHGLAKTTAKAPRAHLLETLAWVRLAQGDAAGAEQAVDQLAPFSPSAELLARLAAQRQRPERVVELLAPLAVAKQLRPQAWPLLVSALPETKGRDALFAACARRIDTVEERKALHAATAKLFETNHFDAARSLCEHSFATCADPTFAFNAACCLGRLGQIDAGLDWLTRAVNAGYSDAAALDADPDLMQIRAHACYAALRALVK